MLCPKRDSCCSSGDVRGSSGGEIKWQLAADASTLSFLFSVHTGEASVSVVPFGSSPFASFRSNNAIASSSQSFVFDMAEAFALGAAVVNLWGQVTTPAQTIWSSLRVCLLLSATPFYVHAPIS
jgi:hypothetical protein